MQTKSLQEAFHKLRRRAAAIRLASATSWAVLAAMVALFVAIWIDLIIILPDSLRVLANSLASLLAIAVLVWALVQLARELTHWALARRLDHAGATGGQIITGLDLAHQHSTFSPMSAHLADIAIDRAGQLAAGISTKSAIPASPAPRAGFAVLGFIVGTAILTLMMPRLAHTEWLRFIDPRGDHPPFSRTSFDVSPGNTKVIYGRGVDVTATTQGPPVDRLDLVLASTGASAEEQVLPMFPELDGRWRASLTQITVPTNYYVRAQRARSVRYRVEVITVPRIESIRLRIEPPAYTRQAVYEGALPGTGISGLPGTRVTLWADSNRALSAGLAEIALKDKPVETVSLNPAATGSRQVSGSFTITADGKLTLRLKDVEGQLSTDEFSASIHLLADARPFVRLLEPESASLATPMATLPITVQAEDDFGISKLQLFRSLNDSRPLPVSIPVPESQPPQLEKTIKLPLEQYGLRPGDTIKLFARTEDNDPAGPKGAESAVTIVRIVSQEDFERMVRTREGIDVLMSKYAQADRRMENMAQELEKLQQQLATQPANSPVAEEMRKQIKDLAEQMEKEASEIDEAAKADLPYDLDKALKQRLGEAANQMRKAAQQAKTLSTQPSLTAGGASEKMKGLAAQCRGGRGEFQKEAMKPLDKLAAVYPLMEDQAKFVILYQQQKSLAERLAALKGQKAENHPELRSRFRDLEQEQQQIRGDLERLLEDIESHLAQVPPDKEFDKMRDTASKFLKDFRKSGATDVQRQAESHLAAMDGSPSHSSAKEAEEIMSRFISRCQGMKGDGQMCLKFQPNLGEAMSATVDQLLADAGLNQGSKQGMGVGSGFSSQRSTLQNVGLYGRLPAVGAVSSAGGKEARRGGLGMGVKSGGKRPGAPLHALPETVRAAGAADSVVPPAYRDRVGQYFERLAEELK